MKKLLLVFMLVLGTAALANAALVISYNGQLDKEEVTIQVSDTVTIDIWNTGGGAVDFLCYLDILNPQNENYTYGNLRWGSAKGDGDPAPSYNMYNYETYDELEVSQTIAQGGDEKIGDIFLIDLHCEGEGDVIIWLWDDREGYSAPVDTLTIHQIPEPATIALLGLGGLLLRRRK